MPWSISHLPAKELVDMSLTQPRRWNILVSWEWTNCKWVYRAVEWHLSLIRRTTILPFSFLPWPWNLAKGESRLPCFQLMSVGLTAIMKSCLWKQSKDLCAWEWSGSVPMSVSVDMWIMGFPPFYAVYAAYQDYELKGPALQMDQFGWERNQT